MSKSDKVVRLLALGHATTIKQALDPDTTYVVQTFRYVREYKRGKLLVENAFGGVIKLKLNDFDVIAVVNHEFPGGKRDFEEEIFKHNAKADVPKIVTIYSWSCSCGATETFFENCEKIRYEDHICPGNWFSLHTKGRIAQGAGILSGLLAAGMFNLQAALWVAGILTTFGFLLSGPELYAACQLGGTLPLLELGLLSSAVLSSIILWCFSSLGIMSFLAATWLGLISFIIGCRLGWSFISR
jgi:hypothetical protein